MNANKETHSRSQFFANTVHSAPVSSATNIKPEGLSYKTTFYNKIGNTPNRFGLAKRSDNHLWHLKMLSSTTAWAVFNVYHQAISRLHFQPLLYILQFLQAIPLHNPLWLELLLMPDLINQQLRLSCSDKQIRLT